MKEIVIDGEIWEVNTEKAEQLGLLNKKPESRTYHIGQRFVYHHDQETSEEYILADVADVTVYTTTRPHSLVNFISLETGNRYNHEATLVLDRDNITQDEMDDLLDGDDNMKLI